MIDMTGWKMSEHGVPDSKWTVIDYAGSSKWNCQCECGVKKQINGSSLRNGNSKSCGKCGSKKNRTLDMTGWKMWEHGVPNSKIIVIKQLPTEGGHALWKCKCSCGNPKTFKVDGANLRSGHTTSCGCNKIGINHKDRSNTIFNNIFIGEIVGKSKNGSYLYDCTCFCGNHFISNATQILDYHVQSCGCLTSKGEQRIQDLLEQMNIKFIHEYSLNDLLTENKKPRRMDFAIFKQDKLYCFIEYQGEQHYQQNNNWYNPEGDIQKKEYCKEKNIPLIEISYLDFNKIDKNYLLEKLNFNLSGF